MLCTMHMGVEVVQKCIYIVYCGVIALVNLFAYEANPSTNRKFWGALYRTMTGRAL